MHYFLRIPCKNDIALGDKPHYHTYMSQSEKISDKTTVVSLLEMPNGGASDITLKKNTTEITTALKSVTALRPVTWHWKTDHDDQELQYGFIAQEVEKVFPNLVTTTRGKDGISRKFLSTKGLLPYLVKALGEQQEQINTLHRKIKETIPNTSQKKNIK